MPEVQEKIRINRPVKAVFEFVANPEYQLLWNSNMVDYEADGPIEKGTRTKGANKVAGRRIDWTSEVIEFDPWRTLTIRSIDAPMDFELTMTFEDVSKDVTEMTYHQTVGDLGGFFGKLADPLVTRMYAHDVRANLGKLKDLLEG